MSFPSHISEILAKALSGRAGLDAENYVHKTNVLREAVLARDASLTSFQRNAEGFASYIEGRVLSRLGKQKQDAESALASLGYFD